MTRRAGPLALALAGLLAPAAQGAPALDFVRTTTPTNTGPYDIATGDFNADGTPDVVTANAGSNTVSVLLGIGNGAFAAKADFATGANPLSVAVGDFNRDGNKDLVTTNHADGKVSVLLGTGSGSFGPKTDFTTANGPYSVAVDDFNHDGIEDLATANTGIGSFSVSVLLGTGTGSFGAKTDFISDGQPHAVATGDFNHNGNRDLVVASNQGAGSVKVLLGNGAGSFGAGVSYDTGPLPSAVVVGDFNHDGFQDLATANQGMGASSVSVLLGTGTGSFNPRTDYPTISSTFALTIGDFNRDGVEDLATANSGGSTVSVLLGTGTGTFNPRTDYPSGTAPRSVVAADFNGDGADDLAAPNNNVDTVTVHRNAPVISLPAGPLAFGAQPIGLLGASQSVTVTNDGFAPLRVSGLAFGGTNPEDFLVTSTSCDATVPSGGTCAVGMGFAPQAAGTRSAVLGVYGNEGDTGTTTVAGSGDDSSVTGGPGAAGQTGATGATGAAGNQGVAGPAGATGAKGARGPKGTRQIVRCTVRFPRGATRAKVTCTVVKQKARRALAWRLARAGRTIAHGVAPSRHGGIALDLGSLRPRLRPGHYELTLGRGSRAVRRAVIVRRR